MLRDHRADVTIAAGFFVLAAALSAIEAWAIGDGVLRAQMFRDSWFDSDVAAYFDWLGSRSSLSHLRTYKHPLFSLILCVPVYGLNAAGLDLIVATRVYIAAIAGLWLGSFYVLLRLLGCRRFDATLFTLVAMNSAAALFWFFGPESYPFGSLAILLAGIIVVLAQSRRLPLWPYVAVNVATFGVTVTDWMAGALATAAGESRKRAVQIFAAAFAAILGLAYVQRLIFPAAAFPPLVAAAQRAGREEAYLFSPEAGGVLNIVGSAFMHSIVMPAIEILPHPRTQEAMLRTQFSLPGSGSSWGAAAALAWIALLTLGIIAFFRLKGHTRFRLFLGLLLLGQLTLHLVYTGRETFLYSLDFAPWLVTIAAMGTLTRWRAWTLGLAGVLLVFMSINNGLLFNQTRKFFDSSDPRMLLTDPPEIISARPHDGVSLPH